jgi:hypothetical protein
MSAPTLPADAPVLNVEITLTQRLLMELYQRQRAYLLSKPTVYLIDLKHDCEELLHDERFSYRTAAEINRAAIEMIVEERTRRP